MRKVVNKTKSNIGQSLVEIIIAIGLLSIVFTGSWQILNSAYLGITNEITELKAHYLVIEGIEGIRSIRGEDWNSIVDGVWHFEYDDSDPENSVIVLNPGSERIMDTYDRSITISSVRRNASTGKITTDPAYDFDENTKLIEVTIEWRYKNEIKSDTESIYLTNWDRF